MMPKFLHLRLEGPFAIVIQHGKSYRICAFTALDATHHFLINDQEIKYKITDSYHFDLEGKGLKTYSKAPEIDPAFDWSNKPTNTWKYDDRNYFITLDLPCPLQIMQDRTARVKFADDSSGLMPLNHILVYEITDFKQVEINCRELGSQRIMADGTFRLELGLTPDGNMTIPHAIHFYNDLLKNFFPDLYRDKRCLLKSIDKTGYSLVTTTLECKNGGIIGQS